MLIKLYVLIPLSLSPQPYPSCYYKMQEETTQMLEAASKHIWDALTVSLTAPDDVNRKLSNYATVGMLAT